MSGYCGRMTFLLAYRQYQKRTSFPQPLSWVYLGTFSVLALFALHNI